MIFDFTAGKKLSASKTIHSWDIVSFTKELQELLSIGYSINILNTSIKFTCFGRKQSFFAELIKNA